MHENITEKLRDFWDAGIRGPDFVWAATGPALEAFSKYPAVKKANARNQLMTVSEFLREVRRMVVDFVVGRVLTRDDGKEAAPGLDDVTTYYLLHRNDFGMGEAPVGGCILYALSCNLSDTALVNQHDLLAQSGRGAAEESEDDDPVGDKERSQGGGAKVKLKPWSRRRGRNLGVEGPGGRPPSLIDQVHRLMHLWRAGDHVKVDAERETPPAEPLLVELLAKPQADDLSTLVLLDEVLTYLRVQVEVDPSWRGRSISFFQYRRGCSGGQRYPGLGRRDS